MTRSTLKRLIKRVPMALSTGNEQKFLQNPMGTKRDCTHCKYSGDTLADVVMDYLEESGYDSPDRMFHYDQIQGRLCSVAGCC